MCKTWYNYKWNNFMLKCEKLRHKGWYYQQAKICKEETYYVTCSELSYNDKEVLTLQDHNIITWKYLVQGVNTTIFCYYNNDIMTEFDHSKA